MDNIYISAQEYVEGRLEEQIRWYADKSAEAQMQYKRYQRAKIVIAALIPVTGCLNYICAFVSDWITFLMAMGGAAVAIIEGLCKMDSVHEDWIQYNYVSESLKQEKYLFKTKTTPYDKNDAFKVLVQRVEDKISTEKSNWVKNNEKDMQENTASQEN